jgi:hypothetical protein
LSAEFSKVVGRTVLCCATDLQKWAEEKRTLVLSASSTEDAKLALGFIGQSLKRLF